MNLHFIIHVPHEEPAGIQKWAEKAGYQCSFTRLYENESFPLPALIKRLVIMGGPMAVYDEDKYPWLIQEKEFIQECIKLKVKMLGVCLGSQLLAEALGAQVYKHTHNEIGWFEVILTEGAKKQFPFKGLPNRFITLHWHGDTFTLPERAKHLAESKSTKNQAFLFEDHILGLQFHMEFDQPTLNEMVHLYPEDFDQSEYVQSQKEALEGIKYADENIKYLNTVLTQFFRGSE